MDLLASHLTQQTLLVGAAGVVAAVALRPVRPRSGALVRVAAFAPHLCSTRRVSLETHWLANGWWRRVRSRGRARA